MRRLRKVTLKNGLRIVLVPDPASLAASVLVLVEAGSEYETKSTNGLSHFLEHMVFKGTVRRPRPSMIAEELAGLGAQFNAFTSQVYTGYWAKAQAGKMREVMDIILDLYLAPLFAPEEIAKERGVVIEELNLYEDTPTRKVQDVFLELLYGDQPAGWDVGGTKKNIAKLSQEDLVSYRRARYVMPGTVVVVAGRFDEKEMLRQIRRAFAAFPAQKAPRKVPTRELQERPAAKVKFKKSDQGHLVLGFRAFPILDQRRYALDVLSHILGGGMSSRLFKKVREELGAAYYVHTDTDLLLDHGAFTVSAGVDRRKIGSVLRAMHAECLRMCTELVPPEELRRAKVHMTGSLILGLETSDELASFYGGQEILMRSLLPPAVIMDRIKKVTAEEVRAVARAVFRKEKANLAVIGPYRDPKPFIKILHG